MTRSVTFRPSSSAATRQRNARPVLEGLEDRLLLYSTLGAHFVYGSRITFSFVPDGTNIGGTPSVLFQTLDAKFSTATWQLQFQKAAAVWQAVANVNFSQVSDDGSNLGAAGYQQGDSRFGDIRISAIPQANGTLATAFLPPPINGGSDAGDIVLNSNVNWQINSTYDLQTVAIHEIGHALGMDHSQITYAAMYASYNGVKQSLASDDIAGVQSIWQAPQPDQFNSNGQSNATFTRAANLNSFIDASAQVSLPDLRLVSGSSVEWFSVTVPSNTTGNMVTTVQSTDLSLLSPRLTVFTSGLKLLATTTTSSYGGTVTASIAGVVPGQSYLIRVNGNTAGHPSGGFGLQLNFGSAYQPPIAPPYTIVPEQPDQGGGGMAMASMVKVGSHLAYGEVLALPSPRALPPVPFSGSVRLVTQFVGSLDADNSPVQAQPAPVAYVTTVSPAEELPAFLEVSPVLQALDSALSTWQSANRPSLLGD